jgi:hypothetical protein
VGVAWIGFTRVIALDVQIQLSAIARRIDELTENVGKR